MSGMSWYKCYPRDFNDGMVGLTLEERGAYVSILNVIYSRGGPIPDDAGYFRALLCIGPKAWSKVRASLIAKRKIYALDLNGEPHLMNERAAKELEKNQRLSRNFSVAAQRRWENRTPEINEINDIEDAYPVPTQCLPNANQNQNQKPEPEPEDDKEPIGSSSSAAVDDWPKGDLARELSRLVGSPWLDPMRSPGLITSAVCMAAWKREGAGWLDVVVPVVTGVCMRAKSPITKWTYFDGAIRTAMMDSRRQLPEARDRVGLQSFAERREAENAEARRLAFARMEEEDLRNGQ